MLHTKTNTGVLQSDLVIKLHEMRLTSLWLHLYVLQVSAFNPDGRGMH